MTDHVLAALSTSMPPPRAEVLRRRNDYVFSPLSVSGNIFTIDCDVWRAARALSSGGLWCSLPVRPDEILKLRQLNDHQSVYTILGLTDSKAYTPPGPSVVTINLPAISECFDEQLVETLEVAGFDVVDSYGLSALCNIGYSRTEASRLVGLGVEMTPFGLIRSYAHAERISALASEMAIEHAPFSPIKVGLLGRPPMP